MSTEQPVDDDSVVSKSEFARRNGWGKSYVSKLAGEGRLVLTDGGKVMVYESLELIARTTGAPERASASVVSSAQRQDRDRKEFYDAENSRLDLEERVGKLLRSSDVLAVTADAAAMLRTTLEALPDDIAADLAAMGSDEARIRAALANNVEALLAELSTKFAKLAALAGGRA